MAQRIQIVSPIWPSSSSMSYGVFVANVARGLTDAGFEVEVRAVVRGRPAGYLDRVGSHLRLGFGVVESALRAGDCLYVHAPTWFGIPSFLASLPRRKTLVLHLHGAETYPNSRIEKLGRLGLAWLAGRADLIVVPSHYFAGEAERLLGVSPERIFVSPSGGVDLERFAPIDRVAARREMGLPGQGSVIGLIGRLDRDKGWDTFLAVLHELVVGDGRPVTGLIVGDGGQREAAQHRARELGVDGQLVWRPMLAQHELPSAYGCLDGLLFPSRRRGESLGLVPIEALAMGIPVVGSRALAVPEYVEHGVSGYLCEPDQVADFATQTRCLLDRQPPAVEAMRAAALAVARNYECGRVSERLSARLFELLDADESH